MYCRVGVQIYWRASLANHSESGQTSQYKPVSRYQSERAGTHSTGAGIGGRSILSRQNGQLADDVDPRADFQLLP
jgi:hypothetical protein